MVKTYTWASAGLLPDVCKLAVTLEALLTCLLILGPGITRATQLADLYLIHHRLVWERSLVKTCSRHIDLEALGIGSKLLACGFKCAVALFFRARKHTFESSILSHPSCKGPIGEGS